MDTSMSVTAARGAPVMRAQLLLIEQAYPAETTVA
jgi:hypothetical protein